MTRHYSPLLLALLLAACGGGGGNPGACKDAAECTTSNNFNPYGNSGSSGSSTSTSTPTVDGMTFSPSSLTVQSPSGSATPLTVTATPQTLSEFTGASAVYVYIVDPHSVLAPNPSISANNDASGSYTANISISSTLAVGNYTGNLQIEACPDPKCASQFPGSPWSLPYNITITSH